MLLLRVVIDDDHSRSSLAMSCNLIAIPNNWFIFAPHDDWFQKQPITTCLVICFKLF